MPENVIWMLTEPQDVPDQDAYPVRHIVRRSDYAEYQEEAEIYATFSDSPEMQDAMAASLAILNQGDE